MRTCLKAVLVVTLTTLIGATLSAQRGPAEPPKPHLETMPAEPKSPASPQATTAAPAETPEQVASRRVTSEIEKAAQLTGCKSGTVTIEPKAVKEKGKVSIRVINRGDAPIEEISTSDSVYGVVVRDLCSGGALTLTFNSSRKIRTGQIVLTSVSRIEGQVQTASRVLDVRNYQSGLLPTFFGGINGGAGQYGGGYGGAVAGQAGAVAGQGGGAGQYGGQYGRGSQQVPQTGDVFEARGGGVWAIDLDIPQKEE